MPYNTLSEFILKFLKYEPSKFTNNRLGKSKSRLSW